MLSSALGHRRHVLVSAKCTPPPRRHMHVICDILEFIPNAWCFVKQRCLEWHQPPLLHRDEKLQEAICILMLWRTLVDDLNQLLSYWGLWYLRKDCAFS